MKTFRILGTILFCLLIGRASAVATNNGLCSGIFPSESASVYDRATNPFDKARLLRPTNSEQAVQLIENVVSLLKKDPIVSQAELGGGVTASYLVTLQSGLKAVYKPINAERPNMIHREVAAFKISHLMRLDIVPPTVLRTIRGVEGSFQLFMETTYRLKKNKSNTLPVLFLNDQEFSVDSFLSGRRLRIFDWLINNHDRGSNAGNYLVSKIDGFIYGIDHSTAFVGHDKQARADKVPYYESTFLQDRELYDLMRSPSREVLTRALRHLNSVRVPEFFQRYDHLVNEFESTLLR